MQGVKKAKFCQRPFHNNENKGGVHMTSLFPMIPSILNFFNAFPNGKIV